MYYISFVNEHRDASELWLTVGEGSRGNGLPYLILLHHSLMNSA